MLNRLFSNLTCCNDFNELIATRKLQPEVYYCCILASSHLTARDGAQCAKRSLIFSHLGVHFIGSYSVMIFRQRAALPIMNCCDIQHNWCDRPINGLENCRIMPATHSEAMHMWFWWSRNVTDKVTNCHSWAFFNFSWGKKVIRVLSSFVLELLEKHEKYLAGSSVYCLISTVM